MKNMYDFFKKYLTFCIAFLLFSGALVLRSIAVLTDYSKLGYFVHAIHDWSALCILCAVLVLIIPVFFIKKDKNGTYPLSVLVADPRVSLFTGILALGAGIFAVSMLAEEKGTAKSSVFALRIAVGVLLFVFLSLLLCSLFKNGHLLYAPAVLIGSIALCLYPVYLYLEQTLPLNADEKIVEEFAFLAVSVYLLTVARVDIGRMQYRFFPAVSFAIALFAAYVSLPAILFAVVRGAALSECGGTPYVLLSVSLFAFFTMFRVKPYSEGSESVEGTPDSGNPSAEEHA